MELEAFEILECMQLWEVADVNISNDNTAVEIIPLETEPFDGSLGHGGQ